MEYAEKQANSGLGIMESCAPGLTSLNFWHK